MGYNYAVIICFPATLTDSPNRQSSGAIQAGSDEGDVLDRMKRGLIQAGTLPADEAHSSEDEISENGSESNGSDNESQWTDITGPVSSPPSTVSAGSSP